MVLDASFLGLVQHPRGKRIISSLDEIIKPELDLTIHLGKIGGFLEPFSQAQTQSNPTAPNAAPLGDDAKTNEQQNSVARRNARDNTAVVKIYQIEDLEL